MKGKSISGFSRKTCANIIEQPKNKKIHTDGRGGPKEYKKFLL